MEGLDCPLPANIRSLLISGGLKANGKSFILDKKKELLTLKKNGKLKFNSHVGFVDEEDIAQIAEIVDYVSFDFVSDKAVIKKVYKVDKDIAEYIKTYKLLAKKIKVYPHITVGIDEGQIHWEFEAIDILYQLGADRLVLNILIPTPGTDFAKVLPPNLNDVKKVFEYARKVFKKELLILGCMRPGGAYRNAVDVLAVEAGFDRIVQPTPKARGLAKEMGLEIEELNECCVID
ncbi:MAG TPA: radical SAM protein [Candidatus Magasanikbacteria bacterium]|nr:radical SAM protein [Candidatus Magasanikbacteria bacterium]